MEISARKRTALVTAILFTVISLILVLSWVFQSRAVDPQERSQAQAREYVELVLALGRLREPEVDAYFGPPELDMRAHESGPDLAEIQRRALALETELRQDQEQQQGRSAALLARTGHLLTLLEIIQSPRELTFADEARELYGIHSLEVPALHSEELLQQLDEVLPRRGALARRLALFRNQVAIPADKRIAVFERALEECRSRTLEHWDLAENERIDLKWSRDVAAAWHHYEGNGQSTLELNPLSIASVSAALDLACHEGYPGHHAQFVLMEQAAGEDGLALEEKVALLRSPASVLREGAAEYGVDLVFSEEERIAFERDVLYPIAGLPTEQAEVEVRVHLLIRALAPLVIPIIQDYRDGETSFNKATYILQSEALITSPSALLRYVDDLGAYLAGYTVAHHYIERYVEDQQGHEGDPWEILAGLLIDPDMSKLQPGA